MTPNIEPNLISCKANDLETLLERYKTDPVFKERHEQHDIQVRILSLLQHLSDSPLNVKWEGITEKEPEEEKAEEVVDWRALLAEGEEEWRPGLHQDDDQLSEWSDEDEGEQQEEEEEEQENQARALPLPQPISAKDKDKSPQSEDGESKEDPCERLARMVQPQYWKTDRCDPQVTSTMPEIALFSYRVDEALRAQGVNTVAKRVLSEYQLLREIIWGLNAPVPNAVFEMDSSGRFKMRENVCLASVTASCLKNTLKPIADLMTHLKTLKDFKDSVSISMEREATAPVTYENYGYALSELILMFWLELSVMEKKVVAQEETFTLFTLLNGLDKWPFVFSELYHFHAALVGRSDKEEHANWQRAVFLISGLHKKITTSVSDRMHDIWFNIYLWTVRPYLVITGIWLARGQMCDFRDELPFARKSEGAAAVDVENETFWTEGVEVRDAAGFVESKGLELPEMWEATLNEILVSGKSVEIMAVLDSKRILDKPKGVFSNCNGFDGLYTLFKDHVLNNISLLSKKDHKPEEEPEAEEEGPLPESVDNPLDAGDLDLDPYLTLAFSEVCDSVERQQKTKTRDLTQKTDFHVIKGVHAFIPVQMIMTRCMKGLIYDSYKKSCDALSKLILKTLDLQYHLGIIRKVFLMEAGDLLFEFYSNLFERIESGLDLDSTSVTMFLRDCLDRRLEKESDWFWLALPEEEGQLSPEEYISKIRLDYEVKWPLSIVLNSETLAVYNKIFLFLLEVKRASWSLRQIHAKELVALLRREEAKLEEQEEQEQSSSDGRMSPSLRVHRVLLLRSWLLHFVGNIHAYFMSRVLHSTELELREALRGCSDLDQILRAHGLHLNRVYDRCFLHSSAGVLREAVLKVFSVCHRLAELCSSSGMASASDAFEEKLSACERDYSRSHQFLSSTLTSMTQRRNVPHLDGLAAALAHSCPGDAD